MKPAPRAGGWCKIERAVGGTVMKEVKGTERDRMFVLFVSKDDGPSWAESARKAMVVLPPHEGQKHQKWSKATADS